MNEKTQKDIEKDVAELWNKVVPELYKKWGKSVGLIELRLVVAKYLTAHSFDRALEDIEGALAPARKLDRLMYILELDKKCQGAAERTGVTITEPKENENDK